MSDIQSAIEATLDVLAEEAADDFRKTMQTWTAHKSPVIIDKKPNERTVYVRDQIYSYINFGTDVRRALLTPDWVSKTQPGVIGSSPGQGLVVAVSRSFQFPGIKARNFDEAIAERIYNDVLPRAAEKLADSLAKIFVEALPDMRTP